MKTLVANSHYKLIQNQRRNQLFRSKTIDNETPMPQHQLITIYLANLSDDVVPHVAKDNTTDPSIDWLIAYHNFSAIWIISHTIQEGYDLTFIPGYPTIYNSPSNF